MIEANLEGVTAVNVSATKAKFMKANLKNTGTFLEKALITRHRYIYFFGEESDKAFNLFPFVATSLIKTSPMQTL